MRHAAALHLERWLETTPSPDPQQQASRRAFVDAGLLAYERLGLLAPPEAVRWRERFASSNDQTIDPGSELGMDARTAAERYLAEIVRRIPPLRRDLDPDATRVYAEFDAAVRALLAVGALDEQSGARWQAEFLGAQAPWLEAPVALPANAFFVAGIPPETEDQAAEDAARLAKWEARPQAQEIRRVIPGGPERHDDLAIVALVVHEDATTLHFHYLGGPRQPPSPRDDTLAGFTTTLDGLTPPTLRDDTGQTYEPFIQQPSSASGAGGIPDPERREAITGAWLYTPAASPDSGEFIAERAGHRWTLRDRDADRPTTGGG